MTGTPPINTILDFPHQRLTRGETSRDVDDGVPEPLQREDEGGGEIEAEDDGVGVHEGVDAVDGGGDPGDEQGDEEEDGAFAVVEGGTVGLGGGGEFAVGDGGLGAVFVAVGVVGVWGWAEVGWSFFWVVFVWRGIFW